MEKSPSSKAKCHPDIQKFPASYGTRNFVSVIKRAHHWTVSLTLHEYSPKPHNLEIN
jgi:hypothetical protein